MIPRRSLLAGLAAALAAPAVVRSGVLMPVRRVLVVRSWTLCVEGMDGAVTVVALTQREALALWANPPRPLLASRRFSVAPPLPGLRMFAPPAAVAVGRSA